MASLNKFMAIGRLTRDPEMRVTPKGTAICQFGLALNRQYKDESGALKDDTTFVDCEAWGKTAELITKYCTKGKEVFIESRLKLDSWEDKASGQKRSKLKVVVEQVQFLGGKDDREQKEQAPERNAPPPRQNLASNENLDEDVPF